MTSRACSPEPPQVSEGQSPPLPASPDGAPPRNGPPSSISATRRVFVAAIAHELRSHLSELNAMAVLAACASSAGVPRELLEPKHLAAIIAQVEASFELFGVGAEHREPCLSRLRALGTPGRGPQPAASQQDLTVLVEREPDIFRARLAGKVLCEKIGFSDLTTTKVVTAISELARNIFNYAGTGSVVLRRLDGPPHGIEVVASDRGPGIADVAAVLLSTYRTRAGTCGGLRGTRDLMDFFDLSSHLGQGTVVIIRKLQT